MVTAKMVQGITRFRRFNADRTSDVLYITPENEIYFYGKDATGAVEYAHNLPFPDRRTAIAVVSGFFGLSN